MSIRVTFVDSAGLERTVDALPGSSVMEAAKLVGIPEITADCGGVCSCASCHVYVDVEYLGRFPPITKIENSLLSLLEDRKPNSRLSCQLKLTDEFDGLTIHTPVGNSR